MAARDREAPARVFFGAALRALPPLRALVFFRAVPRLRDELRETLLRVRRDAPPLRAFAGRPEDERFDRPTVDRFDRPAVDRLDRPAVDREVFREPPRPPLLAFLAT